MSLSSVEILKRRAFFQTRLPLDVDQVQVLEELLKQLNVAQRKAFSKINAGVLSHNKNISSRELIENKVCQSGQLTSHQESMVARSTQGIYKLATANAKVYEQKLQELLLGIARKIEQKEKLITGLQGQLGVEKAPKKSHILSTMVRTRVQTQTFQKIALQMRALKQLQARQEQLKRKVQQVQKRLKEGRFAHVFGGRHLLKQRALIGMVDAAYANETNWSAASWDALRNKHWLIEGSADAPGANSSAKVGSFDSQLGMFGIKIRQTEEQDVGAFWVRAKHVVLPPRKTTVRSTTCVWMRSQLERERSDWAKNLKDPSTKHSGCAVGNPSAVSVDRTQGS